ncbi:MAG: NUDIX domain-containing protein [Vicingaceae bacterium]
METEIKRFNVRVYGLMINAAGEILLSSERRGDFSFTKFPGGGLEFGEGTIECLQREFKEEMEIDIDIQAHFYTTDFFQRSAFRQEEQIISIYYLVESAQTNEIENGMQALDTEEGNQHYFQWKKLSELQEVDLTFPIDRMVLEKLKE